MTVVWADQGGYYCSSCGAVTYALPAGHVTCQACGAPGLRAYAGSRPTLAACPIAGCFAQVWNDGVNDAEGQHLWNHRVAPLSRTDDAVSFLLRVDEQNAAHTHVSVFAGKRPGARGRCCGELVFRHEEWVMFRSLLERSGVEVRDLPTEGAT